MITMLVAFIFISLIITAIYLLHVKDLAHSLILFSGFGLGSTLLFFIFSAPDVALTEAVIGAGISSVVFLVSLLQTRSKESL